MASAECYCGNTLNGGRLESENSCNDACSGDGAQLCGGNYLLNLYEQVQPATTTTTSIVTSVVTTIASTYITDNFTATDNITTIKYRFFTATKNETFTTTTGIPVTTTLPAQTVVFNNTRFRNSTITASCAAATLTVTSASVSISTVTVTGNGVAPPPNGPTTSTFYSTDLLTVTRCAPEITNCPARVYTYLVPTSTTVYPGGAQTGSNGQLGATCPALTQTVFIYPSGGSGFPGSALFASGGVQYTICPLSGSTSRASATPGVTSTPSSNGSVANPVAPGAGSTTATKVLVPFAGAAAGRSTSQIIAIAVAGISVLSICW
ncbi:hypothetical protein L207DRAFT_579774 [Hyaloscypha variabilis F]|uniref:WSC domain-containing protein n=1 Tax=Hyaloscypha variabilis (strain UAMH 11265 / GT02V1 / F) TaxID=1149755 RepID=A0A2J6RWL2_HYAVF|nr:hypothetical protein L207DRAFT_579774 [Hyaloscypha variabilis F]